LEYDANFLYNYGIILSNNIFNFEKSSEIFNKCLIIRPSYSLFLAMGKDYENLNNTKLAEIFYKKANYLIPNRYVPKYDLFKLYLRTNQSNKALEMAREISDMKMKVYSAAAVNIKSEAIEFIQTTNNP
jgi:tetratricopeptide (TPR) repeat protein